MLPELLVKLWQAAFVAFGKHAQVTEVDVPEVVEVPEGDVPEVDGFLLASSPDIAGVATTKNTMAGKSMSVLDNIRYCFVITTSLIASVRKLSLSQMLSDCHHVDFLSYMGQEGSRSYQFPQGE